MDNERMEIIGGQIKKKQNIQQTVNKNIENDQTVKSVKPKSWLFEYTKIFGSFVKPVKKKMKAP